MSITTPAPPRTPTPARPEDAHPVSPAALPTKERDALIDNARFVLIVLVVLGHFLTSMRDNALMDVLYSWIYMFHMPAFVFLSGLVIGNSALSSKAGARIISGVLAPLVIFTVLYEVFGRLIGQPVPSDGELMDPYWLLWFLAALALWRLCVPLLRALRWPVATTLVLATVLVLMTDLPSTWSIDRFFVLMPFFAAGLVLTPDRIRVLRTRGWRLASAGILVASVFVAVWITDSLPDAFITFNDGVESIGDVPEFLAMYLFAGAMILALLSLTPSSRGRMTVWGTRTIYVYLLHGFFVRAFRATELSEVLATPVGLLLVLGLSIGLAIALSSDRVVRLTRRLVEPDLSWMLRADEPTPAAPAPHAVAPVEVREPGAGPVAPSRRRTDNTDRIARVGSSARRSHAHSR